MRARILTLLAVTSNQLFL